MDARGGHATLGAPRLENGPSFDRPEIKTDRAIHKQAKGRLEQTPAGRGAEGEEMTYCHFDEFEDAVLSIELTSEKFSGAQTSPTLWKWVILGMQNALQSAMVLALAGTDGCGALKLNSQKKNREWLQNLTPVRPRMEMENFDTLLAWIQEAKLLEGPVPLLSEEDRTNLKRINQLRRRFAHYNPTGWGIEVQYMLNIMPAAIDLFEHLTTTQGRPNMHFTADQNRRMRRSLAEIRALLKTTIPA
jgi:hypothetical protein